MAATPNLNEIKEACGSNDLADCYKFLFSHNKTEEVGFFNSYGGGARPTCGHHEETEAENE